MKELGRHVSDQTQILFGTAVDGRMGNRLSVTIISSLGGDVSLPRLLRKADVEAAPPLPVLETAPPPPITQTPEPEPPKIGILPEPSMETAPPIDLIPFEPPAPLEEIVPSPPPPIVHPPEPPLITPKKKAVPFPEQKEIKPREKKVQAKQEVLQFEPATRGRFEKSEPTIVEGQDLDVPTFLRKNIRVK
jgi:cell division protein FtsZ